MPIMTTIHLVRHGKAAAGFGDHADPGLAPEGVEQAREAATALAGEGPLAILSSPMARARETARPLAERWGIEPRIEPRVAEIPSPSEDLQARAAWLGKAMAGRWAELGERYRRWRDEVVAALLEQRGDTMVFSHFIAINVAVGTALDDDRLVCFRPDYCSVTVVRTDGGRLELLRQGREAETRVR